MFRNSVSVESMLMVEDYFKINVYSFTIGFINIKLKKKFFLRNLKLDISIKHFTGLHCEIEVNIY